MTVRKLMLPLVGQSGGVSDEVSLTSLRGGLRLGQLLSCHVEACCIAADLPIARDGMFEGMSAAAIEPLFEEIERLNREQFEHVRALFDQAVADFRPVRAEAATSAARFSADFLEVRGEISRQAARRGRLADLTLAATDEAAFSGAYRSCLLALLTETGRPLLVVPVAQEHLSLQRVAIAWNGTSEATRAVGMLLGLLAHCGSITLLEVAEDGAEDGDPADFAEYLAWHGLKAETVAIEQGSRGIGQALQEEALNAGADLMVMGAYTRSHFRRLVFGGASGEILHAPRLPVIMVD